MTVAIVAGTSRQDGLYPASLLLAPIGRRRYGLAVTVDILDNDEWPRRSPAFRLACGPAGRGGDRPREASAMMVDADLTDGA